LLRANKNRFGPVDELALYEMTGQGLVEIRIRPLKLSRSGAAALREAP
jgi:predicted ATP-dependent serine protease